MEEIFNRHIAQMREKLDSYANSGEIFDLKNIVAFYAYDVLGELAFDTQFDSQVKDNVENLPPINDHILLGCLYGSLPFLLPYSMKISGFLPVTGLQKLNRSRQRIRETVASCISTMFQKISEDEGIESNTLLTQLIKAEDPETGRKLTTTEISSEAFGFLVAGSHTTSGTLTLLFYHLLHDSGIYSQVVEEMRRELPFLEQGSYSFTGLEAKLPYTTACMRENFRHTPVFTMPLTRTVMSQGGTVIAGAKVPEGVSTQGHCFMECADNTRTDQCIDHQPRPPS
jgi:benzoate 4-monooxygenase